MASAKMYLLVPENFKELSLNTGIPEENFQSMLDYDKSLGLTSKIYLIEKLEEVNDAEN